MKADVVIPVRLDSRRLPNKALVDIGGKPLLWHVVERVRRAQRVNQVFVATDSDEVRTAAESWNIQVLMTNAECRTGTDRVAEVVEHLSSELVVNVQADEAQLEPKTIDALVTTWEQTRSDVLTPIYRIKSENELFDNSVVKVLRGSNGQALYFSRSPVPHIRDVSREQWTGCHEFWGHVGVYAYHRDALSRFAALPEGKLETAEKLEQLRLLEAGCAVHTMPVAAHQGSVDTQVDLARLRLTVGQVSKNESTVVACCGVILYNRGEKCLVRMLVCLHSLRKWWNGPVTIFLEGPHPPAFEESLRKFGVAIVRSANPDSGAYIRKVEVCFETPYERTLWLDSDTVICGSLDEIFEALDDHDVVTPHFAGWWSDGRRLALRIRRYQGKCPDEWIAKALEHHPAVNMGVFAFKRGVEFLTPWLELSKKGDHKEVFLPEEVAFQILYPQHRVGIISAKFGASVKHDPGTDDIRIIHYHGQKHVHDVPLCDHWKANLREILGQSDRHISDLLFLSDKRLKRYLGIVEHVTLVTACDAKHVEKLRLTFPNWVKYKNAHWYPMIVFVNEMKLDDARLDFLRKPNVRLVPWDFPVDDQREKMLSAFVFGTAEHVNTKYWMKIDADAYATDESPFVTPEMKEYAIYGHRWGRSLAVHISELDKWAAQHRRLNTRPLFDEERLKGDKFIYPRTQSYVQLEQTRFTRRIAKLAGDRLPVPSQDTYASYLADRLGYKIGRVNFKEHHGFGHCGRIKKLKERVNV